MAFSFLLMGRVSCIYPAPVLGLCKRQFRGEGYRQPGLPVLAPKSQHCKDPHQSGWCPEFLAFGLNPEAGGIWGLSFLRKGCIYSMCGQKDATVHGDQKS